MSRFFVPIGLAVVVVASVALFGSPLGFVSVVSLRGASSLPTEAAPPGLLHTTEEPSSRGNATTKGGDVSGFAFLAAAVAVGGGALLRRPHGKSSRRSSFNFLVACRAREPSPQTFRERLVACNADWQEVGWPTVEEIDQQISAFEDAAKKAVAGTLVAASFLAGTADVAEAYPAFAQAKFANPMAPSGLAVCANCHLGKRPIETSGPVAVYPDSIFKYEIHVPGKYEKRKQLLPNGELGDMNVGAIAFFPPGWKLAPSDRLPVELKKELRGLAWAPYSKEKPNIFVVGPVPGKMFQNMILPVLAPDWVDNKEVPGPGTFEISFAVNRGRGQIYPDGSMSNVNQWNAPADGTIKSIETKSSGDPPIQTSTITMDTAKGMMTIEIGAGADILVDVGDKVKADDPLTTDPNVGGFRQDEKDITLADANAEVGIEALGFAVVVANTTLVLKKKQFEKVQAADGFG